MYASATGALAAAMTGAGGGGKVIPSGLTHSPKTTTATTISPPTSAPSTPSSLTTTKSPPLASMTSGGSANTNTNTNGTGSPTVTVMKAASMFLRSTATVHAATVSPQTTQHKSLKPPPTPTPQTASKPPAARTGPLSLADFELGKTLGTGSFGRVRFAKFRNPLTPEEANTRVAIKMLRKRDVVRLNQVEHIINERSILHALANVNANANTKETDKEREWNPIPAHAPHPFIVRLFGTFADKDHLYMCLEFVRGGEFFTHLRTRGHMKNHEAQFYAACVASVFAHLHERDIVYRDLKPENLLLDHDGYIKVTDFGFAKHIPQNKTFTLCGTPEYLAPEILLNQGHGRGVDWWALGVLIYEMLSGRAPFTHEDTMEIYQMILRADVLYPAYFHPDARSLLRRLMQPDLTKRFGCLADGAKDVMTHRWFAEVDFVALLRRKYPTACVPILPSVKDADDTSCFESYPEEDGAAGSGSGEPKESRESRARIDEELRRTSFSAFTSS